MNNKWGPFKIGLGIGLGIAVVGVIGSLLSMLIMKRSMDAAFSDLDIDTKPTAKAAPAKPGRVFRADAWIGKPESEIIHVWGSPQRVENEMAVAQPDGTRFSSRTMIYQNGSNEIAFTVFNGSVQTAMQYPASSSPF